MQQNGRIARLDMSQLGQNFQVECAFRYVSPTLVPLGSTNDALSARSHLSCNECLDSKYTSAEDRETSHAVVNKYESLTLNVIILSTINSSNQNNNKRTTLIKLLPSLTTTNKWMLNKGLFNVWHVIKRNQKHKERINRPRYKIFETTKQMDPLLKEYLGILNLIHSYLLRAARQLLNTYPSNNLRDGPWDLGLATWNVRGLQSTNKFYYFIKEMTVWMRKNNIHIFFIQEHNIPIEKKSYVGEIAQQFNLHINITHSSSERQRGGTMILFQKEFFDNIEDLPAIDRIAISKILKNNETIKVASIYAPAQGNERQHFFQNIRQYIDENTIMGGDFNCVPDVTLDLISENPLMYPNGGITELKSIVATNQLEDHRREQLQEQHEFTRIGVNANKKVVKSRLDRIYTPKSLTEHHHLTFQVSQEVVFKETPSDHQIVILHLETITQTTPKNKDRKSINEQLVLEPEVQQRILTILEENFKKSNRSMFNRWTYANKQIARYLIRETKGRKIKNDKEIHKLYRNLKMIDEELQHSSDPRTLLNQQTIIKEIIEEKKASTRRVKEPELALHNFLSEDFCSKQFFQKFTQNGKQTLINEIYTNDWDEEATPIHSMNDSTKDPNQIKIEFQKYFEALFRNKPRSEQGIQEATRLLQQLKQKAIQPSSREILNAPIQTKEILRVMENLPTGKQAGPNRVPNIVYKTLSKHFAPAFCKVLHEIDDHDKVPKHFLEGDVIVLYKKKDRKDPRNYRPITLLNSDYKIFTRILAQRLKKVVHEFVSETQKGFTPHTFIAENSIILKTIEAYLNDDNYEDRQGIILSLDMEKAFDRVSYNFLIDSLNSLNFGVRFLNWMNILYNHKHPPMRRMYINGQYSKFFPIGSGVAQGCPLSPLLYLVVAETLKIALDNEELQGIKIGEAEVKLLQFADDTIITMQDTAQLDKADKGIQKWCLASSMKENKDKREGLAMGRYRKYKDDLPANIRWAQEGQWIVSLGVPIGNDLNESKWLLEKIQSIREKATYWTRMFYSGLTGRNLIAQLLYLGRLRYWMYSMFMTRQIRDIVQKDLEILWWHKKPWLVIKNTTEIVHGAYNKVRVKGWVRKDIACKPKSQGGLNLINWNNHVNAFLAMWVIRYMMPGKQTWKRLWDAFILRDEKGNLIHPEGRTIVACRLTNKQKDQMLRRIPIKFKYMKECLKHYWAYNMYQEQTLPTHIMCESLWHNWRFNLDLEPKLLKYFVQKLGMVQLAHVLDANTGKTLDLDQYKWMLRQRERHRNISSNEEESSNKARVLYEILQGIPEAILERLQQEKAPIAKPGDRILWIKDGTIKKGLLITSSTIMEVFTDSVSLEHQTPKVIDTSDALIYPVYTIKNKAGEHMWVNPINSSFPWTNKWKLYGKSIKLQNLNIHKLSKETDNTKVGVLKCEQKWEQLLQTTFNWKHIWSTKMRYSSPKDEITWLKLKHRNLKVAKTNENGDQKCLLCSEIESMIHLVECGIISKQYWEKWREVTQNLQLPMNDDNFKSLILLGANENNKLNDETASFLAIAWRCLYRELITCRIYGRKVITEKPLFEAVKSLLERVQAYGRKWQKWYIRQKHHWNGKNFPVKKTKMILITFTETGDFTVNPKLFSWYMKLKKDLEHISTST